jgi:CubicO group peptidase (beta-lactamase class C family)/D-alanyl-D-alanine dipeptidase
MSGLALPSVAQTGYAALESSLRQFVEQKQLPALSIQIVDSSGPVWTAGISTDTRTSTSPVGGDTVYRVGSITKLFTSIALMQLVEEGLVELEAPVSRYLPSFSPYNPFGTEVTVGALMTHRSGLVREPPLGNYFDDSEPSIEAVVASLNATELVYEPGTRVQYSNAAVTVAGRLVEVMRQQPFNEVMRDRLLQPLGMEGALAPSPALLARMPDGLMRPYHGRRFPAPTFELGMSPAGNLYASVNDLGMLLQAMFHAGQGVHGRILEPSTLERMWVPAGDITSARNRQFGIGFILQEFEGELAVGHGGAIYGYSSQIKALPQSKLGVAVSTNLDFANGAVNRIADYALRYALALQNEEAVPEFELTRPVAEETARQLVGEYRSVDGSQIAVVSRKGRLFLERVGGLALELMQADRGVIVDGLMAHDDSVHIESKRIEVSGKVYERVPSQKPDYDLDGLEDLFGEYGEDHNILYISEKHGQLHALIEWGTEYPLTQVAPNVFRFPDYGLYPLEDLRFRREGPDGVVVAADLGGILFHRRELVGLNEGVFRIVPQRPVDELVDESLRATPPSEAGDLVASDLVDIRQHAVNIKLDIRYASDDNFLGTPVYSKPAAYLQRSAADALGGISRRLEKLGYGLLVHDAYRPWYVTRVFWEATPEDKRIFVANPAEGSRHNRGCAIDLTLYDLTTGKPIEMVGVYDEMTQRSYPHYPGGSSLQRWHRDLLIQEMERGGFSVYEYEWWHFDFDGWQRYPLVNESFEGLEGDE